MPAEGEEALVATLHACIHPDTGVFFRMRNAVLLPNAVFG
jgi:hypothetical protein